MVVLFFLFFEKIPYYNINDKNQLINFIIKEDNFIKNQNFNFENESNIIKDIIKVIKLCTNINEDFRPSFKDIIPIIEKIKINFYNEFLNNEKKEKMKINLNDYYKEFSYYQLSKYQESNIMNEEIRKYKKLEEEIKISEEQIQKIRNNLHLIKNKYIFFLRYINNFFDYHILINSLYKNKIINFSL